MGWSIGFDSNWNRDVGYGVPATCVGAASTVVVAGAARGRRVGGHRLVWPARACVARLSICRRLAVRVATVERRSPHPTIGRNEVMKDVAPNPSGEKT